MTTVLSPRALSVARRASALYCATQGRGAPLLLIHGLGMTGAAFQSLIPSLSVRNYTIVPDLRGHGNSSRLAPSNDVERLTDDIENLLDLLRVHSCYVLGFGAGGAIAQQLACHHPERVRGLVLINSYARSSTTLGEQVESQVRRGVLRLTGGVLGGNSHSAQDLGGRTLLPFDSRRWLRTINIPSLVISSDMDAVTPVAHARELASMLPNADLRVLPGSGLELLSQRTNDVLTIVKPWLRIQEAAA